MSDRSSAQEEMKNMSAAQDVDEVDMEAGSSEAVADGGPPELKNEDEGQEDNACGGNQAVEQDIPTETDEERRKRLNKEKYERDIMVSPAELMQNISMWRSLEIASGITRRGGVGDLALPAHRHTLREDCVICTVAKKHGYLYY